MTDCLTCFERQGQKDHIDREDLKKVVNYICGHLNNRTPNYRYWYKQYSYTSKAFFVCDWRYERGFADVAKWGEAECGEKIVDFFEEKEHQNCICS